VPVESLLLEPPTAFDRYRVLEHYYYFDSQSSCRLPLSQIPAIALFAKPLAHSFSTNLPKPQQPNQLILYIAMPASIGTFTTHGYRRTHITSAYLCFDLQIQHHHWHDTSVRI